MQPLPKPRLRPLPPAHFFARDLVRAIANSAALIVGSLAAGAAGLHATEGWGWIDSILNASMILTSMGPLDHPQTVAGKIFSCVLAFFACLVFLSVASLILSPIVGRGLHRFHLDLHGVDDAR